MTRDEKIRAVQLQTFIHFHIVPSIEQAESILPKGQWYEDWPETQGWRKMGVLMGVSQPIPAWQVDDIVFWYVDDLGRVPDLEGYRYWRRRRMVKGATATRAEFRAAARANGEQVRE